MPTAATQLASLAAVMCEFALCLVALGASIKLNSSYICSFSQALSIWICFSQEWRLQLRSAREVFRDTRIGHMFLSKIEERSEFRILFMLPAASFFLCFDLDTSFLRGDSGSSERVEIGGGQQLVDIETRVSLTSGFQGTTLCWFFVEFWKFFWRGNEGQRGFRKEGVESEGETWLPAISGNICPPPTISFNR